MSKVIVDVSVSMDGFMAGPNVSNEYPMGERGHRLHQWLFSSRDNDVDSAVAKHMADGIGAVVIGRRTFDVGFDAWEQQTPYPVPTFVVAHRPNSPLPTASGTFTFITDGPAKAVEQARTAAADRNCWAKESGCSITWVPITLNSTSRIARHPRKSLILSIEC